MFSWKWLLGLAVGLGLVVFFGLYGTVHAGIYDADTEETYKEIWVSHTEFQGAVEKDETGTCVAKNPGGTWYLETWKPCTTTVEFSLPNDYNQATKAELYLDLWRNYDVQSVQFSINGNSERKPDVGYDWSRTPWIGEIPIGELTAGSNSIEFESSAGPYHIHDMAIRLYYNDLAGAPDGELLDVAGISASTGGVIDVPGTDKITLRANVSGAALVEFHAYYYGYDEDNDGVFRDWHNRGRNNCHIGGRAAYCIDGGSTGSLSAVDSSLNGTIENLGTVRTPSNGNYSVTWDLKHIPDQDGVRFKIRIIDDDGNVREAAGGVSADFELRRSDPKVAFVNPSADDAGLFRPNDQSKAQTATNSIELPSISNYSNPLFLHAFWKNPKFALNGNASTTPSFVDNDHWQLAIKSISTGHLTSGQNQILYGEYSECVEGPGDPEDQCDAGTPYAFVERPGAMIVMQRTSGGGDNDPPTLLDHYPARNQSGVSLRPHLAIMLADPVAGIKKSSVVLTVNGVAVTPSFGGSMYAYMLEYDVPIDLPGKTSIPVTVYACDNNDNCMSSAASFNFTTVVGTPGLESDDFNHCALNDLVEWSFIDAGGSAPYRLSGNEFLFDIPEGSVYNLQSEPTHAVQLLQVVGDVDFSLDAKFETLFTEDGQVQGIVVEQDANTFLLFSLVAFDAGNGLGVHMKTYQYKNGSFSEVVESDPNLTTPVVAEAYAGEPMVMRLSRSGNTWRVWVSVDGSGFSKKFQEFKSWTVYRVGPFAGALNDLSDGFTVKTDYFFDTDNPISPEDSEILYLPDVNVVGAGIVINDPECGAPVTLTAQPLEGAEFLAWSGDITGTQNPYTLDTILGNEDITATFKQVFVLDVTTSGTGSVALSPNKAGYDPGEQVTLTASASAPWLFTGWTGDASGNTNPLVVTMDANKSIEAVFSQGYALNLSADPSEGGSVVADPDKGANYSPGDTVTLTATPLNGYGFAGWSGDLTGLENPATITMDSSKNIVAVFKPLVTLSLDVIGTGEITASPVGSPNDTQYPQDALVTLTAMPAAGWAFEEWQGDLPEALRSNAEIQITMDDHKDLVAVFKELLALDVQVIGNGVASVIPEQEFYVAGTPVQLTAQPGPTQDGQPWGFAGWSGDVVSTDNPLNFTLTTSTSVVATFKELYRFAAIAAEGDGFVSWNPTQTQFLNGDVVTVTAVANTGWVFARWDRLDESTGQTAPLSTENPAALSVNENLTLWGIFKRALNVSFVVDGLGTIEPSVSGPYYLGQELQLTAVPIDGWMFDHWEGGLTGTANPADYTVASSVGVTAVFRMADVELTEHIYLPFVSRD